MSKFTFSLMITCCLLFFTSPSLSQNGGIANNWQFGDSAGLVFHNLHPTPFLSPMQAGEGCASISDANGNFLFSTDGVRVWSARDTVMLNGDSLWGHFSATQSALILPHISDSNQYYIFTVAANANASAYNTSSSPFTYGGLSYALVDMSLDNGYGAVILKNIPLLNHTAEKLVGVKHCNGEDYWVIVHQWNSNAFYAYQISATGISAPVISSVGSVYQSPNPSNQQAIGHLKASPNGKRLAACIFGIPNNNIELFDFDNSNGIISNPQYIQTAGNAYGLSFSPDNTKLYATFIHPINGPLKQYDLNAANITASAVTLGEAPYYGAMQLAPDGKLYVVALNDSSISYINHPNLGGISADYVSDGLYINMYSSTSIRSFCTIGLPNYVDNLFNNPAFLGEDLPLCNAGTVLNAGNGWASYNWSTGDITQSISVNQTGTYWVEVIDQCGNILSDTINVFIKAPLFLGNDTVICNSVNDSLLLDAGSGGLSYSWSNGATTQSIYVSTAGTYWVRKKTHCGTAKDTISVEFSAPIILNLNADSILCNGNISTITLNASGANGIFSYNLNGGAFQTSNIFQVGAGTYTLNAKSSNNCFANLNISITEPPPLNANANNTPIACFGDSSTITISASGGVFPYQFHLNGSPPQNDSIFEVPFGIYTPYVIDANDCVFTANPLNLITPPLLTGVIVANGADCYGNVSTISVMANGGTNPLSFSMNGGSFQSANTFNVAQGTYTVVIQDSNFCQLTTNSLTFTQTPPIIGSMYALMPQLLCANDTTTLIVNASGGFGNFMYSLDGGNVYQSGNTFQVGAGVYIAAIKDAGGCTLFTQVITISEPTALSANVCITPIPCHDETASLSINANGGTTPYQYSLNNNNYQNSPNFSNLSAGTYTIFLQDSNNCQAKINNIQIINPLPLSIWADADTACYNQPTLVSLTASGGTGAYEFSVAGNPFQAQPYFSLGAGNYPLNVQDSNHCTAQTTLKIAEYPDFQIGILQIDSAYCNKANGSATVLATGGNEGFTYTWFIAPIQYSANLQHAPKGTYFVRVQDAKGCQKDTSLKIPQIPMPTAVFASIPSNVAPIYEQDTIHFVSFMNSAYSFSWDFGDGNGSTELNPTHSFYHAGNFPITLTAYDYHKECPATYNLTYHVSEYWASLFIPNVFTPNTDGFFDSWKIEIHDYQNVMLKVFDRWGVEVFQTNDLSQGWNGNNEKGRSCETGVYFYSLNIQNFKGENQVFKGNVTLIR